MPHCIRANEVQRGEISSQRRHSYGVAGTPKLCVLCPQMTCLSSHTSYRLRPPHTCAPHSERPPVPGPAGHEAAKGPALQGGPGLPKQPHPFLRKPGSGTRGPAPMNAGSQNDGGSKDSRNDHRWANGTEKQQLGQPQCRGFCGLFPIFSSLSKCDLCC